MLTRIEVKNYKLFRHLSQSLENFQILVGANATGKTTFLDVVGFVSDIVNFGLEEAVARRTNNFDDLTWQGKGGNIEVALEFALPEGISRHLFETAKIHVNIIRYELEFSNYKNRLKILYENIFLFHSNIPQSERNGDIVKKLNYVFAPGYSQDYHRVCVFRSIENVSYIIETLNENNAKGYFFKLDLIKTGLSNAPLDISQFPASSWLRELLTQGIQKFMLDSEVLRKASPPNQGRNLKPNGGNLPWVLEDLKKNHIKLFKRWLAHVQTTLPDIKDIKIIRREDDAHKYFKVLYENGVEVPSWLVSDGTLRMLALTLLAYLPNFKGIYLIEEPENGIHPKAVETVFQSLSSVYDAQVLVASHSTAFLSVAEPKQLLCFTKDETGEAHVIKGNEHPRLQHWKGETNLSILFAGGVLE